MNGAYDLEATARAMVAEGKGILAVDESTGTCTKRFEELGIVSTADSRRAYREMMFTTPHVGDYVTGVILYDETIRQRASDGRPMVDVLTSAGILPGIKVDIGVKALAGAPGETVTEGLDDLRARLEEYRDLGARFTKWRAVFTIDEGVPSSYSIRVNAHALARYAALVQEVGMVPIVEPEVLRDGAHDIERCETVTAEVLQAIFDELRSQRCLLEGMVLKPNMVSAGSEAVRYATAEDIAQLTLKTLKRYVPAAVPGIAFLSGGQTGAEACENLSAMAAMGPHPWRLTYSFGRALQYPAIDIWGGDASNIPAAQAAFAHRLAMSANASLGRYMPSDERPSVRA